ncbi:MAG: tetraacyldisaccharide 4'-kinase [Acidobacteriota bacterium]
MKPPFSARRLLLPLVPVYRLVLEIRERRLRSGQEPVRKLRWPVISIGNLSAGGAGKTPLVITLAQALVRRGLYVDVLSRGYGRHSRHPARVDPEGTAEEFGDEPLLIAREAKVPVYVAAQRYEAGLLVETGRKLDLSHGLHLLDDGFQHRQLHRDVNILLLSREDCEDRLLPAGNMREPLSALRRATVVAIPAGDDAQRVEAGLRANGWQGPVWRLLRRMDVPPVAGPVAAFCGIARPAQFFEGLEAAGLRLAARIAFPDHHRYTAREIRRIQTVARNAGAAAIITTEKDGVRLGRLSAAFPDPLPLKTAHLRVEIEDEDVALDFIESKVC